MAMDPSGSTVLQSLLDEAMDPSGSTLLQSLLEMLKRLLHLPIRSYVSNRVATAAIPVDVKEYPHSYVVITEIPSCKSNNIEVEVENNKILNITCERKKNDKEEEGGVKYRRMERGGTKFTRKFILPADCNVQDIHQVSRDEVIIINIPKLPPLGLKKLKTD